MGRILAKGILCGAAGALAWIVTAPIFPQSSLDMAAWARAELALLLALTSLISLAAGLYQGWQRGGRTNIISITLLSLLFGTIGGMLGYFIGGNMAASLFPGAFASPGFSVRDLIARIVVHIPIGLLLGAGVGLSLRTTRGVVSGAMGGLAGGLVAGALFDIIGSVVGPTLMAMQTGNEVGIVSRGFTSFMLGAGIGIFTAIFDQATRQAWVRLVLGRNEGREWPLDAPQTMIGRDERAHVPLFADPQLPALAAVIQRQGGQYVLLDPGSPIGVGLNGLRVQTAALNPGDTIQVGSLQLQFLMKAGAARRMQEGRAPGMAVGVPQAAPMPSAAAPSHPTQAYASSPTALTLLISSGPMAGHRQPLIGALEIGREGAGLSLSHDTQASRRHALLTPTLDGAELRDLGSTNGTYVNGQRVQAASVKPGDAIRVGSTELQLVR